MDDFIKLVLPFFSVAKNYAQVLKKLASFAFYETYLITLLLRSNATIDGWFASIEGYGHLGTALKVIPHYDALNLSGIAVAFVVAIISHAFQFHDRISDVLGIRKRFDQKQILIPLASRVGTQLTQPRLRKIRENRDDLVHAVFYKYASSRADNPLVDKHDIEQAMNAWSWYWVFVEGSAYFSIGVAIAWYFGSSDLAKGFAITVAGLVVLANLQRLRLNRYARPQVDTIAADVTAAADVRRTFDAL